MHKASMKNLKDYLFEIADFHTKETPLWKNKREKLDYVFDGKTYDVLEKIFNNFYVDENLLREDWLKFLPSKYEGHIRFYQSSGTTGKRKFAHWDKSYMKWLVEYLKKGLDEIYKVKINHAIVHGPYGWYQEEMSELIWSYGGKLYFIGIEVEGMKKELQERGERVIEERFGPLIRYTSRVLEKDERVNTIRTAPQLTNLFAPKKHQIENLMISGVEVNRDVMEKLKEDFPETKIIPLYGHFLFGDCVGIYENGNFYYYPPFPPTIIFPVKEEEGYKKIVNYEEVGKFGLIVARPEIFLVTVEDEFIGRCYPRNPFEWDGFSNPNRKI